MTEFTGFPSPTRNFFSLPNEMINIIAGIDNMAELKVIIYVIRHTWGYQEYGITKAITVEEFMHGRKRQDGSRIDAGTGLKSDRSVKDGLKAAIGHGYLIYDVDDTDRARIKKAYALKMSPESGQVDTTPQTGSIYPSEVQNLPLGGAKSTPRSEKDTKERHLEKDTKERQAGTGAFAPTPPLSSSQEDDFDPETTQFYQNWLRNCEVARANGDPLPPRPKHMIVDSAAELLSESAKLKAIVTAQLNRFEVTSEMETPADGDGAATTQRMAAVKIGGTNGERIDAAVHGAGDRGAAADTDGQSRAGLAGVSAGVASVDRASSGAVSAGLALSSNTSVASSQTVRGATDALGSRSGGATLPHAARLSPASGSESRAPGGKPRIPERPKMERPQLTLEGSQVKGWLEDIWDVTISQRAGNIKDLNDLGTLPDASHDSLKTTIEFLEAKKWVKEHDVAITLHILSGNDARFEFLSFENNWQAARRKRKQPTSRNNGYSLDMTEEDYARLGVVL